MRGVLLAASALGWALFAQTPAPSLDSTAAARRELPNLLFVTIDTLRADHLASYGYHLRTSPRIDRLAREGVRFERAYSTIPLTGPSHYSIFTGRYPQEHGARINGMAVPADSKWLMFPQVLRRFGFQNAAFVSAWPLTARLTHLDRHFDLYDQDLGRTYQFPVFNSMRWAEEVTPLAVHWLEERRDPERPFLLWVHFFDPHSPYNLREEFANPEQVGEPGQAVGRYDEEMAERVRLYDSEIGYADHHFGMLLDAVDRLGLRDSTIVVMASDHGESLGEHDYVGHGQMLTENIVRVPWIMRYPGRIPAGKVVSQNVTLLDMAPTLLDLIVPETLTEPTSPLEFVGRSLAPAILSEEQIPERMIRYLTFSGKKGWFPGWLVWISRAGKGLPLMAGHVEERRKTLWFPGKRAVNVYDLAADPFELEPIELTRNDPAGKRESEKFSRWFKATDLQTGDSKLTTRDREVLRSLGYIQ